MSSKRTDRIAITIEPTVREIAEMLAAKKGQSLSDYGRSLVINDLHSRGLLPEGQLVALLAS